MGGKWDEQGVENRNKKTRIWHVQQKRDCMEDKEGEGGEKQMASYTFWGGKTRRRHVGTSIMKKRGGGKKGESLFSFVIEVYYDRRGKILEKR